MVNPPLTLLLATDCVIRIGDGIVLIPRGIPLSHDLAFDHALIVRDAFARFGR